MSRKKSSYKKIVKKFRVLNNWNVDLISPTKDTREACVIIDPPARSATIVDCRDKPPKDFVLHEVLHAAISALILIYSSNIPEEDMQDAEEDLVQDICKIVYGKESSFCKSDFRYGLGWWVYWQGVSDWWKEQNKIKGKKKK